MLIRNVIPQKVSLPLRKRQKKKLPKQTRPKRMQKQLFCRLRGNLQLPECLRIVGYLRRMGGFTENGLREEYLGCRDA